MHNPVDRTIYRDRQYTIEDNREFFAVLKDGWKHEASFKTEELALEYVKLKEEHGNINSRSPC
jgi:hypothetical protein